MSSTYIYISLLLILSSHQLPMKSHSLKSSSSFLQTKQNDPYNIYDHPDIYYAEGPCTISNCDNCITSNKCQCPSGYAQNPDEKVSPDVKSCQYKQKYQTVFFILELLLPFGAGHFYAGRILNGILKLAIVIIAICADVIVKKILKTFSSEQNFNIAMYAIYFCLLAWQMVDIVCIGINAYKDGKGISIHTMASK